MGIDFRPRRRRETRVRFYVCCRPLMLPLVPFVAAVRLVRYGALSLLGRPATWPWAS